MKELLLNLLLSSVVVSAADKPQDIDDFQYDYCSWTHSQHVIDRLKSEVIPIFNTYDIQMVNNGN